jgi:hypothetical protein
VRPTDETEGGEVVARTKEERDALRAELEQEEADEAERSKGGGRSQNLHVDVTEAVRDKLISKAEGRRLLGLDEDGDDDGGDGDGDGDDSGDDDKGKGKGKGKKDDDDDDAPADRTPRRRGYFDSGDS